MIKKYIGLTLALMLLMCPSPVIAAELDYLSYQEALQKAAIENKKIMIFFWAEWCPWCTKARTDTLNNPVVKKELNKNFVSVSINVQKDPEKLAQKYEASGLPTFVFLDAQGELLGFWPGFADKETFLKALEHINSLPNYHEVWIKIQRTILIALEHINSLSNYPEIWIKTQRSILKALFSSSWFKLYPDS